MNAADQLIELYHRWRALSEAEAAAIETGSWEGLARAQQEKARLQPRIGTLVESVFGGPRFERDGRDGAWRRELRRELGELIRLEDRNKERLQARMAQTEAEISGWDRTVRQVGRIRHVYGGCARTAWESYS